MSKALTSGIPEDAFEDIRDRFFKATNLDLRNLESSEVRGLLELLPAALLYLHNEYDMSVIYEPEDDDDNN